MKAENKQQFIETWDDHAESLFGLANTALELSTMQELEDVIKSVKVIIRKVAEEGYGDH